MAIERTLSIVKPDATRKNFVGRIVARFEEEGLRVAGCRKTWLSLREAQGFYAVHAARPFFGELTEFMSSGPCVVVVLEGEGAIARNREIMGATNPANAAPGTLRKLYAASVGENAVHGSDSEENGRIECSFFFAGVELV